MTKVRLLGLMVFVLVIINLILLITFFLGKPHQPDGFIKDHNQPKRVIIKRLHFDSNQIDEYEKLIAAHRLNIRKLDEEIRETKNTLYSTLNNDKAANPDSLISKLADLQKQIETVHYNHFSDIKKLCKPNQIPDFNELTQDLSQIFAPEKNLPPPPKDL